MSKNIDIFKFEEHLINLIDIPSGKDKKNQAIRIWDYKKDIYDNKYYKKIYLPEDLIAETGVELMIKRFYWNQDLKDCLKELGFNRIKEKNRYYITFVYKDE